MNAKEQIQQIIENAIREAESISQPASTAAEEGMPLQIDPVWKWAARDEDGGTFFYDTRPVAIDGDWCSANVTLMRVDGIISLPETSDWRDSLHEIKNGRLIKHVDIPADGEPVLVRYDPTGEWKRRVSAGRLEYGELVCYADGCNKWTSKTRGVSSWLIWRRPTQEELNQ